jgi:hypothetical protein
MPENRAANRLVERRVDDMLMVAGWYGYGGNAADRENLRRRQKVHGRDRFVCRSEPERAGFEPAIRV